jgi:hypothetical protein
MQQSEPEIEVPVVPFRPRIYEELQDEYAIQTLIVVRGVITRDTPDFESFQRTNRERWEQIEVVLVGIEYFCQKCGISVAEINGRALAEAARIDVLTKDDIMSCLRGIDDFIEQRRNQAAARIQKTWLMFHERKLIRRRKTEFRAAFAIQKFWRWREKGKMLAITTKKRLQTIRSRAAELANSLCGGVIEAMESDPYLIVHVIETLQDLTRCFDLMYKNAILVLLVSLFPPAHIWEEFIEVLAQGGVGDPNDRIYFIVLREGESALPRLLSDMKSLHHVRRLRCDCPAILIPHCDWSLEASMSVDIQLPIFGFLGELPDSRVIFQEANIVAPFASKNHIILAEFVSEILDLIRENRDIKRWMIRLVGQPREHSLAWFDVTPEFFHYTPDLPGLIRQSLHCIGESAQAFLSRVPTNGARIEAVPDQLRGFPNISLFSPALKSE